jgi:hypothetical protein
MMMCLAGVTESAPATWRWREWILFGANLALAVVGIAGIIAAYITLLKLERQTKAGEDAAKAAKDNAEAARLNAQAVINAERAWITVVPYIWSPEFYPLREKTDPVPDDLRDVLHIVHQFPAKIVNVGKTPAKLEALALRYVRTPTRPSRLGPEPDYGELSSENNHFAFPNEEIALTAVLSPEGTMTKSQIAAVQNKEEFLYSFGIVKYSDVYGILHETRFGYRYQMPDTHMIMRDGVIETVSTGKAVFRNDGLPSAYNGHT